MDQKVAIQLNDTHPSLAIVETLRILIDIYGYEFLLAWNIVTNVFSYTNHTLLPEALEKWGVGVFQKLLPRHMELIYMINFFWMEKVRGLYPDDQGKVANLSIIEESNPKKIRMASLSVIGSHRINGVARMHSFLVKTRLFKDFSEIESEKFLNITNGVTIRRWILCANPELAKFYTKNLGTSDWLVEFTQVEELSKKAKDPKF